MVVPTLERSADPEMRGHEGGEALVLEVSDTNAHLIEGTGWQLSQGDSESINVMV